MLKRFLAPGQRYVLVIGDKGAVLAHVVGGKVRRAWAVTDSHESALGSLADALAERPRVPVTVVVDLSEQSYRRETIPPIGPLDRHKVLRRRLHIVFPSHDIKGAVNLREQVGPRGDLAYLFVALPSSPELDRWIAFLGGVPNPVANLSLLPVESAGMVGALARATAGEDAERPQWIVFVSHQRSGGLRQIVVQRGRLALTRLIPDPPDSAAIALTIEQELATTRAYLGRLGYKGVDGLDLIVIGDGQVRQELDRKRLGVRRLTVLAPGQAGGLLGLAGVDRAGDYGELLHAAWAASKRKPALELAPAAMGRRQLQEATRRWAVAGLTATAAALAAYTGNVALDLWSLKQEVATASAAADQLQRRLDEKVRAIEQYRVSAATVVATLDIHARLVAESVDPVPTLVGIGESLGPNVRLTSLAWKTEEATALAARRVTSSSGHPGAGSSLTMDCVLTVDLSGVADPERAVAEARALAERLQRRFVKQRVEVIRQALAVLPTQTFSGSFGGAASHGEHGEWSAEITISGPAR